MTKFTIYFILLISLLLVNYGYTLKKPSEVEIEDFWGEVMFVITEDNSEITNFKCVAKNKPEPSGTFQWTIGDKIVKSASISEETTKTGDETSTFEYTPKVEDNEKKLKCEYIQEENGQITKTASTEIVFTPISKQILPKSPFKLTEIFEVGADAEIKLNLELFPEPNYDNYRWVIETDQTLELPTDMSTEKYESKLKVVSGDKYEALLVIKNWQESDAKSKYFYKVVNTDGEKRIDIELPKTEVPTETTTLYKVPNEDTTITPEPESTGLGIGIYIIISLVVLIVLACIGYCIWQKYFREKEPEPKTQDAEKGNYDAVPQSDQPAPTSK